MSIKKYTNFENINNKTQSGCENMDKRKGYVVKKSNYEYIICMGVYYIYIYAGIQMVSIKFYVQVLS